MAMEPAFHEIQAPIFGKTRYYVGRIFFLNETDLFFACLVLGVNFDEIMRVTRAAGFFKWHKSRNLHSISLKIRIRWQ